MINPAYKIRIDDLTIRCYEPEDAVEFKKAIDSSLKHLHKYMEWSHSDPEPLFKKITLLEHWKTEFIKNVDYTYAVFRGEKMVASSGLHKNLEDNNSLEIGYWVRADEINKGIATKVSLALIIIAFEIIKVKKVEIHYEIDNVFSSKIPKRLKLKQEKNYFHDTRGENCKWYIDKNIYDNRLVFYKTLYNQIAIFNIDNKQILK